MMYTVHVVHSALITLQLATTFTLNLIYRKHVEHGQDKIDFVFIIIPSEPIVPFLIAGHSLIEQNNILFY